MTMYNKIKSMDIGELAEWLNEVGDFENAPWMKWWNENYCEKCDPGKKYFEYIGREVECAYCELHDNCRFFDDMPSTKQIIIMWLKSGEE